MSTKTLLLVVCLAYTVLLVTSLPLEYPSDENNPFLRSLRAKESTYCVYRGLKCMCDEQNKPKSCGLVYYNPRWNI